MKLYHVHPFCTIYINFSLWSFIRNLWPFTDSMCFHLLQLSVSFHTQSVRAGQLEASLTQLLGSFRTAESTLAVSSQKKLLPYLRPPSKEPLFPSVEKSMMTTSGHQGPYESWGCFCGHF